MTGLKKPRIRNRQPKTLLQWGLQLTWGRHWLLVGAAVCATAFAGPPPAAPPAPPTPPVASKGAPDDDFIEFLGRDDVGDAAWWEFLKKVPPRREIPPAAPPQEAKQ
jgi:hypothetical protein